MDRRTAHEIFRRFRVYRPEPRTELEYRTPYQLLVSVILSAQATDVSVNKATRGLFEVAPDPASMIRLGEEGLKSHIRTIGLFNTKAANILETSRILLEKHDSQVPADRDALEALPGVGRKTANVVLNCAFGQPTVAVDTHIFRVANRTGLAPGKTPLDVERGLERKAPRADLLNVHHWLILHGRYVCTARKPRCTECLIQDLCRFPDKPGLPPRTVRTLSSSRKG